MKTLNRQIKIYFWYFKKQLKLIKIGSSTSKHKYSVTVDDLDDISTQLERTLNILNSCIYYEQLDTAENYITLFNEKFPFAVILSEIFKRLIKKKRTILPHYDPFELFDGH